MLGRLRAPWAALYLPLRVGLQYITNHRSYGLWREDEISRLEKKELESRLFQNYEDRFQYPLALAVLCLAVETLIGDRRKL